MTAVERRTLAFDGLRGAAGALAVLGHVWTIVPAEDLARTGGLYGLFLAGNLAISSYLVLASFLVTTSLLEREQQPGWRRVRGRTLGMVRFWGRRLARIGPQLAALVAVVWAVSQLDRWDDYSAAQTRRSLVGVSTFTFNRTLIRNPFESRPDLGHLWYLSVEQQFLAGFVLLLLVVLWRWRSALVVVLPVGAVAVMVWRFRVLDTQGWWFASLKTTCRIDGLLLGAAAAIVAPRLRAYRVLAARATMPAGLVLIGLLLLLPELGSNSYLEYPGIVGVVATAALVLSIAVADRPRGGTERMLSWRPWLALSAVSYPLYLWHLPVFYASARWMADWRWAPRAAAAVGSLAVVVALTQQLIERPVVRWLTRRRAVAPEAAPEPVESLRRAVDQPV